MGKFYKAIEKSKKEKGGSKDGFRSKAEGKAPDKREQHALTQKPGEPPKRKAEESDTFSLGSIHRLLDEAENMEFPGADKTDDIESRKATAGSLEKAYSAVHTLVYETDVQPPTGDEKRVRSGSTEKVEEFEKLGPKSTDKAQNQTEKIEIDRAQEQRNIEASDMRETTPATVHEDEEEEIIELDESSIIKPSNRKTVAEKPGGETKKAVAEHKKSETSQSKEKQRAVQTKPDELPEKKIIPLKKIAGQESALSENETQKIPEKESAEPSKISASGGIGYDTADSSLVTLLRPRSFESEQFKLLRTNLMFPASGKPPRSLLITSALPGDGKSFVAANLAVSYALNIDRHVLVIDADIRKPQIHRRFGLKGRKGLSDYLTRNVPLPQLLIRTMLSNLTILPGGKPPHNPSELLSSEKMPKLLKEVTTRYADRYVLIDSPPPKLTAETGVLARLVDGIILVVRAGETRRELVEELVNMLGKDKILGVVFNYYDTRPSKYYGYSRYGKRSKSYSKYYTE